MSDSTADRAKVAAFFDVDGTLVQTTIAHYYVYFRRRRMTPLLGKLWNAAFMVKCGYYVVLDKINRSRLNVVFYRSYAGLPASEIRGQAMDCYHDVMKPRRFEQAAECMATHRNAGHEIVLATGSIDFIIAPLAKDLGADSVISPTLAVSDGRFTGELDGLPISEEEKARRIEEFADARGIDLSQSHAYGDSIADLPMLEIVGHPHAVNPDKALAATARARGWPVHHWTVAGSDKGRRR
jgi:HAD superfamily hydrolase (TIGR01490 family)